jgi:multicomponent Na+:H+ antiporter subunit E
MKIKIVLFITALLLWLGLTWSVDTPSLLVGIGVAILVVFLISDMFPSKGPVFVHPARYFWLLYYIIVFLWECTKANIDVAYRVIHPKVPINPGIVKVKTSLKSEIGITFLANSITLTPGTLTVDLDKEAGCLYIHWIDVKDKDIKKATDIIVRKFERILRRIFE